MAFDRQRRTDVLEGVIVDRRTPFATIKSQPISLSWLVQARRRISEADAVIVHMPNFLAPLALLLAPRRPTLLFWHSDVVDKGWIGRLLRPLERLMLARAAVVWVTTQDYATGSTALRGMQDKIELLTLGIPDPTESDAHRPLPDAITGFARGRPIVLTIGRLVPYKGFDTLLHAFARVDVPAVLVIAGTGPQHDTLAALIAELGLADRVLLAGRVATEVLHALFRSAQLYVMSSTGRTEAFGVVQIEAMAFSLPVVTTDVPRSGVGWVSGYGDLGALVPIHDPEALAGAIVRVLTSEQLAMLRRKARARYARLFRVEQMVAAANATLARLLLHPIDEDAETSTSKPVRQEPA